MILNKKTLIVPIRELNPKLLDYQERIYVTVLHSLFQYGQVCASFMSNTTTVFEPLK